MKKLIICLSFFLLNNFAYAKISLKNFQINEKNKIYSNYDVKYFINLGFKLVTQETRGTRTVYILKREEEYLLGKHVFFSLQQTITTHQAGPAGEGLGRGRIYPLSLILYP